MKKINTLIILLVLNLVATAQVSFESYLDNGMYIFDDTFKVTRSEIFTSYKSQFGLGPDDEMELVDEIYIKEEELDTVKDGSVQSSYKQKYKGYSVEGKRMNLLSKCEVVLFANGSIIEGLDIDVSDPITEEDALNEAIEYLNPAFGFSWEDTVIEMNVKEMYTDTATGALDTFATTYPLGKGELVVAKKYGEEYEDIPGNYALCWKFGISYIDTTTLDSTYVDSVTVYNVPDTFEKAVWIYVNANTGEIWNEYNPARGWSEFSNATVWTWYNGYRTNLKNAWWPWPNSFIPWPSPKGSGYALLTAKYGRIETYKMQSINLGGGVTGWTGFRRLRDVIMEPYATMNNQWIENNTVKEGATAMWSVQQAYDYFANEQGMWHNNGVKIMINSPQFSQTRINGARYSPPWLWPYDQYGRDVIEILPGWGPFSFASLDVIAHEYTHGMIYKSSQVGYYTSNPESFALNEGFADIFGLLTESYVHDGSSNHYGSCDWLVCDDPYGGAFTRRFFDPQSDNPTSSNYYNDASWGSGNDYYKSGVLRKWFSLVSEGSGSWTNPSGLGLRMAGRISFIMMYWWMWSGADFHTAKNASLAIARIHYNGACEKVWNVIDKAWADVGLGPQSPCNPLRIAGPIVVTHGQLTGSVTKPIRIVVSPTIESGITEIQSYDWILPTHWTGTLSNSDATYTLTDVSGNYTSQEVKCIVEYIDEFAVTKFDTLTEILHFCPDCNDSTIVGNKKGKENVKRENPRPNIKKVFNGKNNNLIKRIDMYPNPSNGHMNVVIPEDLEKVQLSLYDMTGRRIFNTQLRSGRNHIDLPNVPTGIYMCRITSEKESFVEKIQIQ